MNLYQVLGKKYMVKTIKLDAIAREESQRQSKELLRSGFVPAVLYGAKTDNVNIKIKKHDIDKIFAHHDTSGLIDLSIDGGAVIKTIIKDEQRDVLKNGLIHLDFYKVDMKHKLDIEVPLHFINESKAVKELGGTLIKNMETIEVKCLPTELLEKIDIDLSLLNTFDDTIKVGDLKLPEDFELITHAEETIVHVMEPKAAEAEPVIEQAAPATDATATTGAETAEKTEKKK
jgi:large subunit ribosomal protein L25